MYLLGNIKCEQCYKPVGGRLGLFEAKDDYECYTERYIKCFWGLCDRRHISQESLLTKPDGKVITVQPKRQELRYKTQAADNFM